MGEIMCSEIQRGKGRHRRRQQDGLCALILKSQSYVVLFLKRKSEGLAMALP